LKAAQEVTKTSLRKIYKGQSAFTLIEILIVIGIIAFVAAVAVPRFESINSKMRREVRTLVVLMKRLHHLARLNRQTYRLVIDFPENDEHKYWVESTSRKVLFANPEEEDKKGEETPEEKEKERASLGFSLDRSLTREPTALPKGVYFESLELAGRRELITSGRAYIHFLPEGMAEESALMLTDKKEIHWTILLNPLTGQGRIVNGKASLKESSHK
jgi:prepilin-type N-terminal cleavage/methylation domain-containing protein